MIGPAVAELAAVVPGFIPSPDQGVWNLGPIPLRAYALIIVIGILVGVWIGEKRWVARGGEPGTVGDVALWAVPFGIVGGRIYHVVSDNQLYFGENGAGLAAAMRIWDGGLGIWGAILGGGLGAWIAMRRKGIPLPPMADAVAPALVLAQAIGRWGNYANQELFGAPTSVPWALEIDQVHRPAGYEAFETFHPTFLYESLWNVGVFVVLILADRKFRMGHGRVFALYVALYCLGRLWVESLRIDTANHILGLRLNVWTSIFVGVAAVIYIVISARKRPGREAPEDLLPEDQREARLRESADDSQSAESQVRRSTAAQVDPETGTDDEQQADSQADRRP